MRINKEGLSIIKQCEGCRLKAYLCPSLILTIGYGHTTGVKLGDIITQADADRYLLQDIKRFEQAVSALVKVPINENQFSALVSFAFNVGVGNLKSSTLLKKLNLRDYKGCSNEFDRWVYGSNKKPLEGLKKRRKLERELFNKSVTQ